MAKYEVIWTEYAVIDLERILNFITTVNPANLKQVYGKIMEKARTLSAFPDRGRVIPELKKLNVDLFREIFHDPWRIMYKSVEQKVIIMAVFDARRDLEEVILHRLMDDKL